MKLKKVTIDGFRGAPRPFELRLDGKSLCLLGENGNGKTTIAEGLEYWSTGRLENFAREGCGLDAAINLDHDGPATITCERQGHATLRRKLSGPNADDLEIVSPAALDSSLPPRLPILRHGTMAGFMDNTPGKKKRALLSALGLAELLEFRDTLVTAAGAANRTANDAKEQATGELSALGDECAGASVIQQAEAHRVDAGLGQPITTETDLLSLDLARTPAVETRVNRAELVEKVARNAEAINAAAIDGWNKIVKSREAAEGAALHDLVSAGQKVLESWGEDVCPLCLKPDDRSRLSASLAERAVSLAKLDERFRSARFALENLRDNTAALADAITTLLGSPPMGGWPHADVLRQTATRLKEHADAAKAALADDKECLAAQDVSLDELLSKLRAAAVSDLESPASVALVKLERLRMALQRSRKLQREAEAKQKVADAIGGLRELAEQEVRAAVEGAISTLGTVAADFYGRLVLNPVYSDVELKYTEDRSGGIEFTLTFDARHRVSPPQRVVSDSQLNALGLALFLARLKIEDTPWRTLVLDDVVNSFDADHRMGLARLLTEEFSDWQVLLFTHDNVFAAMSERFFIGWRFWQIAAWTPREGPTLSEGDPLKRLKARLEAGETASDLGGLARVALERGLSRPLERLGLAIRFDRRGRHTATEYLDALQKGLAERESTLKDLPVLTRMKGASYLANIGAHDRQADPSLSTNDLRQMVNDLQELEKSFTCINCDRPAWEMQEGNSHFQCECSKLAV